MLRLQEPLHPDFGGFAVGVEDSVEVVAFVLEDDSGEASYGFRDIFPVWGGSDVSRCIGHYRLIAGLRAECSGSLGVADDHGVPPLNNATAAWNG